MKPTPHVVRSLAASMTNVTLGAVALLLATGEPTPRGAVATLALVVLLVSRLESQP